jgi:hypothetical protein
MGTLYQIGAQIDRQSSDQAKRKRLAGDLKTALSEDGTQPIIFLPSAARSAGEGADHHDQLHLSTARAERESGSTDSWARWRSVNDRRQHPLSPMIDR